ncbi:hypothetical protein [Nostoc sp. FACHB-888]|uniref:phage tail protein n=1 Tax=Nostoc sp. FACHB-888 TaxID=2692842 RepID=UPI0016891DE7|nr:hypothetical protein [Nostoc sp. FACHB-888]MBD2245322.1 hypothetical protein [Nostoc sp. FACHB-888]
MSGSADPLQIDAEQAQSDQQVQEAKGKAMGETDRDFGDKNIFPNPSNETLKAKKELSKISADKSKGGDFPVIEPEVANGLNQGLTPYYQEKIAPEHEKYSISKQKFDSDSENAKKDSNKQIADLNQETTQKQKETKEQAQQEVNEAKQDWKKEIDKTDKDYQDKAGKANKDQRQKVEDEKKKGEGQVDQEMKKAEEEEAAAKKKEADEKAAGKKKEKSERKSGWDKFVGFFKDAWDAIKDAVSAIFDALRKVVKAIFDAVKAVVNGIIDAVRAVIVGIIKAFGEVLKVIVKVVFAAFPEISKKFTDKIDQVVNKATEAVNKAADFLKKAISTVLDFLAKILDKLLELARDIVKGIMTVIGMLLTGQFKELIEGFSNLIKAAKTMPEQFETAALEELLGGGELDLDKPLSPEELAQAEQAGVNIPRPNAENSPEGEQAGNQETQESGEMPQAPWTEENVGVDTVEDNMELSPEIAEQLTQQTNGEGEVMLAESGDKNRSMDAVMSETGQKQTQGEQQPQQEQQIPDDGLSPKQRADIKWQMMKQGIKKWFSDNWPILLGALIAASAVIIAAIVASGGAVLAALPMILDILMVVFAAEIIARIGGYLRDYFSKAWQGDIKGGGKSLAKALAAGAIELALLLTFEAGKLATKGAKAAGKGAGKVAKGAGDAAKKAGNAVVRGSKYVIKKGKVLFKGIGGTKIGKQFKKLDDLGRALLDRMRFKAFRILIKNRRFRLEGLINPWVLIASGEIKHFNDKDLTHGPNGSVTTPEGKPGTIITEGGSAGKRPGSVQKLEEIKDIAKSNKIPEERLWNLQRELDVSKLEKLDDAQILKELQRVDAEFNKLAKSLGSEDIVKKLGLDLKLQDIDKLITDLGDNAVKKLSQDLKGSEIQTLVTDLGNNAVKKLSQDLKGNEIQDLVAKLGNHEVKILANNLSSNQVKQLLTRTNSTSELQQLLHQMGGAKDAAKLLQFINQAGPGQSAKLLDILNLVKAGDHARLNNLLNLAGSNPSTFQRLADITLALPKTKPTVPNIAPPPATSIMGGNGANMQHFIDGHTFQYLDISQRLAKPSTTLWPRSTTPNDISNYLQEAINELNRTGRLGTVTPGNPKTITLPSNGITVQDGVTPSYKYGQFFPVSGNGLETISRSEMNAIWDILKP